MNHSEQFQFERRVQRALIFMYCKQTPSMKPTHIIVSLLVVVTVWSDAVRGQALLWFGLQMLCVLGDLLTVRRYKKRRRQYDQSSWLLLSFPELAAGILWGAAAWMFADHLQPIDMLVLTILLLGILSGSLFSFSLLPPLYPLFAGAVLLQYGVAIHDKPGFSPVLVGTVALAVFFIWMSQQLFHTARDMLFNRYKNREYARKLKIAQSETERASLAKTRFFASASHDIRQPLQAISFYIEYLHCRIDEPESLDALKSLHQSYLSMRALTDALLDISKLDADMVKKEIRAVDLQALMAHLYREFAPAAEEQGLMLRHRCRALLVSSDAVLLERIVMNLISNALRYTEHGGVLIACRRRGDRALLEVWDSGRGIAAAQREKIFTEFYQVGNPERDRQKGLGLGLAIVKRLVDLLPDHALELCSKPGHGSRFRLSMPLAGADEVAVNLHAKEWLPTLDTPLDLAVLVIENDLQVRQSLVDLMRMWGCRVSQAEHADAALAQVTAGFQPDAVIADYRLPGGKTGVEAIRQMREAGQQKLPALLLTGESLPETLRDIQRTEELFLLHKPVAAAKLKMFLRRVQGAR